MMNMMEVEVVKDRPCLTLKGDDYIDGVEVGGEIKKELTLKLVEESLKKYGEGEEKCQRFEVISVGKNKAEEKKGNYGDGNRLSKMAKGGIE